MKVRLSLKSTAARRPPLEEALGRFRNFLREKSLHSTSVREELIKAIIVRKGHFDADELAADVRSQGVSKATVYRALPLLLEAGILQPAMLSGQRRRYETALGVEHHDHLICSDCGEVVEFQFEAFEVLQHEVASKYGYRLMAHCHELVGICSACQSRQTSESKSNGERPSF